MICAHAFTHKQKVRQKERTIHNLFVVQKTSNLSVQLIKIKSRNSSFIAGLKLLLSENVQRFTSYSYTIKPFSFLVTNIWEQMTRIQTNQEKEKGNKDTFEDSSDWKKMGTGEEMRHINELKVLSNYRSDGCNRDRFGLQTTATLIQLTPLLNY